MASSALRATGVKNGPLLAKGVSYPGFKQLPKRLVATGKGEALLCYEDGSPGLVWHPLGRGATLYFASNPFNVSSVTQHEWLDLFRSIQQWSGSALDHSIWRFTLPMASPDAAIPQPQAIRALTGNHVEMVSGAVFTMQNEPVGGSYRYRRAPEQEGRDGEPIAFEKGKLTDRQRAYQHATRGHRKMPKDHVRNRVGDWSIQWKQADHPLEIAFDFNGKTSTLDRLVVWVAGEFPPFEVVAGGEVIAGHEGGKLPSHDVRKVEVPLQGRHDGLELRFAPGKGRFHLAEVEIWGGKSVAGNQAL